MSPRRNMKKAKSRNLWHINITDHAPLDGGDVSVGGGEEEMDDDLARRLVAFLERGVHLLGVLRLADVVKPERIVDPSHSHSRSRSQYHSYLWKW